MYFIVNLISSTNPWNGIQVMYTYVNYWGEIFVLDWGKWDAMRCDGALKFSTHVPVLSFTHLCIGCWHPNTHIIIYLLIFPSTPNLHGSLWPNTIFSYIFRTDGELKGTKTIFIYWYVLHSILIFCFVQEK